MALTGKGLVDFAKSKLGTPYFYGSKLSYGKLTEKFMNEMHKAYPNTVTTAYIKKAKDKKMVGKVCVDCSGLIAGYTGKMLGSSQLCSQAKKKLAPNTYKDWANGVVVWRSGHVGIFFKEGSKYYVYEAKGIDYGTVKSTFEPSKWTYGLTFDWMTYDYKNSVSASATSKKKNPYAEPKVVLKKGMKGNGVAWLQWELVQAGYDLKIDDEFGTITENCVLKFQQSCKITADGEVGKVTKAKLCQL